ncbi:multisubunit sodium/proton antiporter, MrpG subunit [Alkalibacterium subtropicum]|uniref:Multisubunit sodium/proton antiporter, MrpG subunit n=1 Tax=Alkalibacterium subtropicum TaxID=753702 RepID=A0A1I1JT85_9LACT|nr:monovalent cation/H(+) antiporter subunit G [Alkalibacterium subtropicum]SFC51869.1 multisubunit sodium/proton antiporter, MrpG subunit [Alkalibacterium subtropicum]
MAQIIIWIANTIIIIGLLFMALGVFGIYQFNDYFSRILVSAKVDTVGFITIMLGLILKHGFDFFSGKLLLVLALYVITNPIATHAITRSAHISGYRIKKER